MLKQIMVHLYEEMYSIPTNDKFSFVNADKPWMTRGSYVCGSTNILLGHSYAKEAIRWEFFPGHGTSVPSSLKNPM